MTPRARAGLWLAPLLLVGMLPQAAHAQDPDGPWATPAAVAFYPPSASGFGGVLAWSEFDASTNRYRLVARTQGVTQTLPIRDRYVPFDVDLGPDATGRTVAVYSRCQREGVGLFLPYYRAGRGCRIYEYRFDTRRETRLATPLPQGGSAFLPSIWGKRLAYAVGFGARLTARATPQLFVRVGSRKPARVAGGPPGGPNVDGPAQGPIALDLRGDQLLFTWWSNASTKRCGFTDVTAEFPAVNALIAVDRPGARERPVARGGCSGDPFNSLRGASWIGSNRIAFLENASDSPAQFVTRQSLATGARERHQGSFTNLDAYAEDGAGQSVLITTGGLNDPLASFDPLVFSPTAPA